MSDVHMRCRTLDVQTQRAALRASSAQLCIHLTGLCSDLDSSDERYLMITSRLPHASTLNAQPYYVAVPVITPLLLPDCKIKAFRLHGNSF